MISDISNIITAVSTFAMAVATTFMAIAAWQAKNSFVKERGYNDYLALSELLKKCQDKILFMPVELMDKDFRNNYTKDFTNLISEINKLLKSAANYLQKNELKNLIIKYNEISKFYAQLIQQACPFEGMESARKEYLQNMADLNGEFSIERIFLEEIKSKNE